MKQSNVVWVFSQAGNKKTYFILSVVTAILGVVCGILPFLITGEMIARLLQGQRNLEDYIYLLIGIALSFLGKAIFHAISTSLSHSATFQVLGNIRKKGLAHISRVALGDVLQRSSGELKNILIERVDAMETTLAHIVPEFTSNILAPMIILVLLFIADWRMALVSIITIPLGMFCFMGMMRGYEANFRRTVTATKKLNDTAVEYIEGIQVIKAFSKSGTSYAKFVNAAREAADSYINWMRKSTGYFTFAMSIMPATLITVLPIGGYFVMNGSLAADIFIYCIVLSLAVVGPLITCMSYSDDIGALSSISGEIRSIMEIPCLDRPKSLNVAPVGTDIVLKDVTFGYQEKEVLHGVNMEIKSGEFVAFVGPSGSGKSTIARLISSLWDVKSGDITFGGINIKDIPLDIYSDQIAFVSQDNYLFNQSIRENIRMGKTTGEPATDEEVEAVARQCGCYEFIMSLADGFDTVVGSSGGHLSGGERQRIAIARAMLKNAPVVILDEATAYTDPENESLIQQSVAKLVQGKTLIVIAHRLSTIKDADNIFVINHGRVEEVGDHETLLKQQGLYAQMWNAHISVKDQSSEEKNND